MLHGPIYVYVYVCMCMYVSEKSLVSKENKCSC
jgi:hypothetical protein